MTGSGRVRPPEPAGRGRGIVVAVGGKALEAARLTADARDLRVHSVPHLSDSIGALSEAPEVCVLVVPAEKATPAALLDVAGMFAKESPSTALGVLHARTQDLLRQAALRLGRPPQPPTRAAPIVVFNGLGARLAPGGAGLVDLGLDATSAEEALNKPHDTTFVIGHSNGVDMSVGPLVLCNRDGSSAASGDLRVLSCWNDDRCFRVSRGSLPINKLESRLIVSATCWGISLGEFPFASSITLGDALLHTGGVQSLLTVVRAEEFRRAELTLVYHLMRAGLPLGQIAGRTNALRMSYGRGAAFVCFGDPEARAAAVSKTDVSLHDLTCPPSGAVVDKPIAVLELSSGALVGGVVEPDGTVHYTVQGDERPASISIETAGWPASADIARLLRDLDFLQSYLPALSNAEGLEPALDVVRATRLRILRLAVAQPEPGSVTTRDLRVGPAQALQVLLRPVALTLVSLYRQFFAVRGGLHLGNWRGLFSAGSTHRTDMPCRYCSSVVRESTVSGCAGDWQRSIGNCDLCGLIYDGDPEVGRWLEAPSQLLVGRTNIVSFEVRSPYEQPMPVGAVASIERFQLAESITVGIVALVEHAEAARIEVAIPIPAEFPVGTHYLSGAVILGGQVQFYRRTAQILGAREEERS